MFHKSQVWQKKLIVQKWAEGHFSSRKCQRIWICCHNWFTLALRWKKCIFFCQNMESEIIKIVKKHIFDHCVVIFWLIWQQIPIPWLILPQNWPAFYFCTIIIFVKPDIWCTDFNLEKWAGKIGGQWGQLRPTDDHNDHSGINSQPSLNRKPLYIKVYYIFSVCQSQITCYCLRPLTLYISSLKFLLLYLEANHS